MTKSTLSKSAAIREATGYVSIAGSGTSFHIYGPARAAEACARWCARNIRA